MYKNDVKEIQQYVQKEGPSALAEVAYCVIGSIRTKFYHLDTITKSIKEEGAASKHIWGHKNDAYDAIQANKYHWYNSLVSNKMEVSDAITLIAKTKGIGLAKSGFLLQMLGYNCACLDVHNLNRLGISSSYFSNSKRTAEYVDLVQKEGSEYWWDTWCQFIFEKDKGKHFNTVEEVSKFHVTAIKGK